VKKRKVNLREKILVSALLITITGSVYFQVVFKRWRKEHNFFIKQRDKLSRRLEELKNNLPDIEESRERIDKIKKDTELLKEKVKMREKELPGSMYIPVILERVTTLADEVTIQSLNQRVEEYPPYTKLFIEVKCVGSLPAIINYLYRVESLGKFITLEKLEIFSDSSVKGNNLACEFLIGVIMGKANYALVIPDKISPPFSVRKDVFTYTPQSANSGIIGMQIEGITYNKTNPVVIINGEVLRLGSLINGFEVVNILPDRVILNKMGKEYIIKQNR
jgi:Tfp pilus assembly protein PilO